MTIFATQPTSPYYAFHDEVFDWSFEIMDIVPTFDRVLMEREFQLVRAGQAVTVIASIKDIMTTPGQRYQFNPGTTPQIQLYNPDGTVKVAWVNMVFIATGLYNYQHQTTTSDQLGNYTAQFRATNGTMTGITDKLLVFEILSAL